MAARPSVCRPSLHYVFGSGPVVRRATWVAVVSLAGRVFARPRVPAPHGGRAWRQRTPADAGRARRPVTAAARRHALAETRCRVTRGGSGSSVVQEPNTATGGI